MKQAKFPNISFVETVFRKSGRRFSVGTYALSRITCCRIDSAWVNWASGMVSG